MRISDWSSDVCSSDLPDIVRSMTPEMFFDYLGVRLNGPKAAETEAVINVDLGTDGGKYLLELGNGVLNHTAGVQDADADASNTLTRATLNRISLQEKSEERRARKEEVSPCNPR